MKKSIQKLLVVLLMTVMTLGGGVSGAWASSWSQVGSLSGDAASVNTLVTINNTLYAGTDNGVWTWNGTTWSQLGTLAYDVQSLVMLNGTLYAGSFYYGVWAWNGSTWAQVGTLSSHVQDLAVVNNNLYVATGDGVYAKSGSNWTILGLAGKQVLRLLAANDTLYAGTAQNGVYYYYYGDFQPCGSNNKPWGTQNVGDLHLYNYEVYAGTKGGGVWSFIGSTWYQRGGALSDDVFVLTSDEPFGTLYAGTNSGVKYLGGGTWNQVGSLSNRVVGLTTINNILYAGTSNNGVWVYQ
ncbi:hypothetical protein Psch_03980 [Pelotomaculum schinkii]|uniref:Uncharacterized protein n=1 Tax=Pelotomaculum schinkii TaxID=78350 RepID=A0A4Y7R5N3_9FIRM|nr:hypothetical protein [Pelotomaculum schinkii]TEB04255.1 hypothetical protein Psch_03980 [Pelotomaculum schinkii]